MGIIEKGKKAYKDGNFKEATELFELALQRAQMPEDMISTLLSLANAYDELGEYSKSLNALKRALEINRESSEAWNNLGFVCQKIGKLRESFVAFENAYKLNPENQEILINLGSVALKLSDPGNAKQYLELAIELNPSHPIAHANLALTLAIFGRLEEAEEELRLAVLYGYSNPDPIHERIEKLKKIRSDILHQHGELEAQNEDESESIPNDQETLEIPGEEAELLAALEKELFSLVEKEYALRGDLYADKTSLKELHLKIRDIRRQVKALRRSIGLPEVSEGDTYMGRNYMESDE